MTPSGRARYVQSFNFISGGGLVLLRLLHPPKQLQRLRLITAAAAADTFAIKRSIQTGLIFIIITGHHGGLLEKVGSRLGGCLLGVDGTAQQGNVLLQKKCPHLCLLLLLSVTFAFFATFDVLLSDDIDISGIRRGLESAQSAARPVIGARVVKVGGVTCSEGAIAIAIAIAAITAKSRLLMQVICQNVVIIETTAAAIEGRINLSSDEGLMSSGWCWSHFCYLPDHDR
ncbi:hypothetical protein TYRP_004222 [Tyrophagus putrescentiae]|nr:hypothetical protein TYRP_004222 [Tyrophagus putrescentiae]